MKYAIILGWCCFSLLFLKSEEKYISPEDDYNLIIRQLKPGDILHLKPGIYHTGWVLSGIKGRSDKPVIISGGTGTNNTNENAKVVFRPQTERDGILFYGEPSENVIVDGIHFEHAKRGGVIINGSKYITIRNCTFSSNGYWGVQTCMSDFITIENCVLAWSRKEHGIYFSTTDHPVAQNNYIHHNNRCGIHMNGDEKEGGDGMISYGIIRHNRISLNGVDGGAAINMDGVEKTIIQENFIENNFAGGIVSFCEDGRESGSGNEFLGNVIVFKEKKGRYGIKITGIPEGIKIFSNEFFCCKCPAVELEAGKKLSGFSSDKNKFQGNVRSEYFLYGGKRLNIREWNNVTGQDKYSSTE